MKFYTLNDPASHRVYGIQADDLHEEEARKLLFEKMEYDHDQSKPVRQRKLANQDTSFECPHCKTHEKPVARKLPMTEGGLFWRRTYLKDVFSCGNCGNEFSDEELSRARQAVQNSNMMYVMTSP